MKKSEFLRAFEELLEIDAHSIDGTELLKDVAWWDSLAALVFIGLADEKLEVTVTGTQLQQCNSVPELLAVLGDKLTAERYVKSV